jgi:hypothetical protein
VQQGLDGALGMGLRVPESHDHPNWVTPATPGTRPLHAPAAKRDISSCAGCHDGAGSNSCVGCHQVGGIASQNPGASPNGPHPSSFVRKHRGESKDGMCAACHH